MKNKILLSISLTLLGGAFLFAQPKADGAPKAIVKNNFPMSSPTWSPDGTKLALTSMKNTGIWVVDADGENLKQITNDLGAGYKMKWAVDNASILSKSFTVKNNRKYSAVKVYNTITKAENVLIANSRQITGLPYFVADNAQIEYKLSGKLIKSATGIKSSSKSKKVVQDRDLFKQMLSDPANVTSIAPALKQFAGKTLMNPVLSPSGDNIAFQIPGEGLFVCSYEGSDIKRLGYGEDPTWTSDGKYLVVSKSKDNGVSIIASELFSINVSTGAQAALLSSELIPQRPSISPDGKKIAFEDYATGFIYVMNLK